MDDPAVVLKGIIDRFGTLNIHEKRVFTESSCELVFLNKQKNEWESIFSDILGSPVKPQSDVPSEEDISITSGFGGICKGQTLFRREYRGATIIAMFWPWDDPRYTTLKVAIVEKR
jgi:hypothetical protein